MKRIIETLLVIGAFSQSIWLGIFTIGYIIYIEADYKNLKKQLKVALFEDELTRQPKPKVKGTPIKIYDYKKCIIEEHRGFFYKILMPNNKFLDKVFFSLEDAKKEIDLVEP